MLIIRVGVFCDVTNQAVNNLSSNSDDAPVLMKAGGHLVDGHYLIDRC